MPHGADSSHAIEAPSVSAYRTVNVRWPSTVESLTQVQTEIGGMPAKPWVVPEPAHIAGVFICFARERQGAGRAGDQGWAAAAVVAGPRLLEVKMTTVTAAAPFMPGWLALREGPLLEQALVLLETEYDAVMVDASGRDHPRRAGLAVQLGVVVGKPSLGVTRRPLVAQGSWPEADRAARSSLRIDGELVGYWLRTQSGRRPVVVHAGWRTTPQQAVELALQTSTWARTPEPLRQARRAARQARSASTG